METHSPEFSDYEDQDHFNLKRTAATDDEDEDHDSEETKNNQSNKRQNNRNKKHSSNTTNKTHNDRKTVTQNKKLKQEHKNSHQNTSSKDHNHKNNQHQNQYQNPNSKTKSDQKSNNKNQRRKNSNSSIHNKQENNNNNNSNNNNNKKNNTPICVKTNQNEPSNSNFLDHQAGNFLDSRRESHHLSKDQIPDNIKPLKSRYRNISHPKRPIESSKRQQNFSKKEELNSENSQSNTRVNTENSKSKLNSELSSSTKSCSSETTPSISRAQETDKNNNPHHQFQSEIPSSSNNSIHSFCSNSNCKDCDNYSSPSLPGSNNSINCKNRRKGGAKDHTDSSIASNPHNSQQRSSQKGNKKLQNEKSKANSKNRTPVSNNSNHHSNKNQKKLLKMSFSKQAKLLKQQMEGKSPEKSPENERSLGDRHQRNSDNGHFINSNSQQVLGRDHDNKDIFDSKKDRHQAHDSITSVGEEFQQSSIKTNDNDDLIHKFENMMNGELSSPDSIDRRHPAVDSNSASRHLTAQKSTTTTTSTSSVSSHFERFQLPESSGESENLGRLASNKKQKSKNKGVCPKSLNSKISEIKTAFRLKPASSISSMSDTSDDEPIRRTGSTIMSQQHKSKSDTYNPGTTPQNSSTYNSQEKSNHPSKHSLDPSHRHTTNSNSRYHSQISEENKENVSPNDHSTLNDTLEKILAGSKMDKYSNSHNSIVRISDHGRLEKVAARRGKKIRNNSNKSPVAENGDSRKNSVKTNSTENTHASQNNPQKSDSNKDNLSSKKNTPRNNRKWGHDRFDDFKQQPKSNNDLVKEYGYDIRDQDKTDDKILNQEPAIRKKDRRKNKQRLKNKEREKLRTDEKTGEKLTVQQMNQLKAEERRKKQEADEKIRKGKEEAKKLEKQKLEAEKKKQQQQQQRENKKKTEDNKASRTEDSQKVKPETETKSSRRRERERERRKRNTTRDKNEPHQKQDPKPASIKDRLGPKPDNSSQRQSKNKQQAFKESLNSRTNNFRKSNQSNVKTEHDDRDREDSHIYDNYREYRDRYREYKEKNYKLDVEKKNKNNSKHANNQQRKSDTTQNLDSTSQNQGSKTGQYQQGNIEKTKNQRELEVISPKTTSLEKQDSVYSLDPTKDNWARGHVANRDQKYAGKERRGWIAEKPKDSLSDIWQDQSHRSKSMEIEDSEDHFDETHQNSLKHSQSQNHSQVSQALPMKGPSTGKNQKHQNSQNLKSNSKTNVSNSNNNDMSRSSSWTEPNAKLSKQEHIDNWASAAAATTIRDKEKREKELNQKRLIEKRKQQEINQYKDQQKKNREAQQNQKKSSDHNSQSRHQQQQQQQHQPTMSKLEDLINQKMMEDKVKFQKNQIGFGNSNKRRAEHSYSSMQSKESWRREDKRRDGNRNSGSHVGRSHNSNHRGPRDFREERRRNEGSRRDERPRDDRPRNYSNKNSNSRSKNSSGRFNTTRDYEESEISSKYTRRRRNSSEYERDSRLDSYDQKIPQKSNTAHQNKRNDNIYNYNRKEGFRENDSRDHNKWNRQEDSYDQKNRNQDHGRNDNNQNRHHRDQQGSQNQRYNNETAETTPIDDPQEVDWGQMKATKIDNISKLTGGGHLKNDSFSSSQFDQPNLVTARPAAEEQSPADATPSAGMTAQINSTNSFSNQSSNLLMQNSLANAPAGLQIAPKFDYATAGAQIPPTQTFTPVVSSQNNAYYSQTTSIGASAYSQATSVSTASTFNPNSWTHAGLQNSTLPSLNHTGLSDSLVHSTSNFTANNNFLHHRNVSNISQITTSIDNDSRANLSKENAYSRDHLQLAAQMAAEHMRAYQQKQNLLDNLRPARHMHFSQTGDNFNTVGLGATGLNQHSGLSHHSMNSSLNLPHPTHPHLQTHHPHTQHHATASGQQPTIGATNLNQVGINMNMNSSMNASLNSLGHQTHLGTTINNNFTHHTNNSFYGNYSIDGSSLGAAMHDLSLNRSQQ